jgi:hypothetical protein
VHLSSSFERATPIYLSGRSLEKNCQAGFRRDFTKTTAAQSLRLGITAATFYRVYLNGVFLFHGPARAPHRMARVDYIDLSGFTKLGTNKLAIEVAGYNEENIYVTGDASFLVAEVVADGNVIDATDSSWIGVRLDQRRKVVERFSHARCANELFDLDARYFSWRTAPITDVRPHAIEIVTGPARYLPRGVEPPNFAIVPAPRLYATADLIPDASIPIDPFRWCETGDYGEPLRGGIIERPAIEDSKIRDGGFTGNLTFEDGDLVLTDLKQFAAFDYDFVTLASGFLGITFSCTEPITLDLVHGDRLDSQGRLDPRNCGSNCVIRLHAKPGQYRFESFEPYCVRYARVIVRGSGTIRIQELFLRGYQFPDLPAGSFACDDGALNRIYESARLTLRANMLDVFMDCPGRERAGWLCDSLWSGRAARMMLGDSSVERAMLENFMHAAPGEKRKGFFPSCYPAVRIVDDIFIPNWSLFLILELFEYFRRTADRAFVDQFQPRIDELLSEFAAFENPDGLLENLPGHPFLDWSSSNLPEFVTPISTAGNALYAAALDRAAELYGRSHLAERAKSIRETLRAKAAGGAFFADSIERTEASGSRRGRFSSEAAQYYLYWFGVGDPMRNKSMWQSLLEEFGPLPDRYPADLMLARSNVFIGQYIRLELLGRFGEHIRLLREIRHLFGFMIDHGPGTLWENLSTAGSVCHGFASHVAVWLVRDFLGLGIPDAVDRHIDLAPHPCELKWAAGSIAVGESTASLRWSLGKDSFDLSATVPSDYTAALQLPPEVLGWTEITLNDQPVSANQMKIDGLSGGITLRARRRADAPPAF